MSGLYYVGKAATAGRDISTQLSAEGVLTSGVSREYVQSRTATAVAARAAKAYVDTQDSGFAEAAYYSTQDALLVPNTAKGVANGVASLDGTTKLPAAQVPVLGAGILRGPYGPSSTASGSTTDTPMKVATWNLGATGITGQLLAWMTMSMQSDGGRPVLEIRVGDNTQTTYAAQTLIAMGVGQDRFKDYQMVTAFPATAAAGEGQDGVQDSWSLSTNLLVNAWVYDSRIKTLNVAAGAVVSAVVFVARTTL